MEIILLSKTCQHQKLCVFHRDYFSAIIQNPIHKSHRLFVKGTGEKLTSGLAYTNKGKWRLQEVAAPGQEPFQHTVPVIKGF